ERALADVVGVRPALDAEALAIDTRRATDREARRLDEQGAGAAHRIEERRLAVPTRETEHRGGEVLLERRLPLLEPVAAPVERLAREIQKDAGHVLHEVDEDAHVGVAQIDRGACAAAL